MSRTSRSTAPALAVSQSGGGGQGRAALSDKHFQRRQFTPTPLTFMNASDFVRIHPSFYGSHSTHLPCLPAKVRLDEKEVISLLDFSSAIREANLEAFFPRSAAKPSVTLAASQPEWLLRDGMSPHSPSLSCSFTTSSCLLACLPLPVCYGARSVQRLLFERVPGERYEKAPLSALVDMVEPASALQEEGGKQVRGADMRGRAAEEGGKEREGVGLKARKPAGWDGEGRDMLGHARF